MTRESFETRHGFSKTRSQKSSIHLTLYRIEVQIDNIRKYLTLIFLQTSKLLQSLELKQSPALAVLVKYDAYFYDLVYNFIWCSDT